VGHPQATTIERSEAMIHGERDNHRGGIEIRLLSADDGVAVKRLAQLDSTQPPLAPLLGAFGQGRLLAALSLGDGAVIADPFVRTAELREVLQWRAANLHGGPKRRLRNLLGRVSRGAPPASSFRAGGPLPELGQRRPA